MTAQVGVRKARQLATEHALQLVPVHHMEAHALVSYKAHWTMYAWRSLSTESPSGTSEPGTAQALPLFSEGWQRASSKQC